MIRSFTVFLSFWWNTVCPTDRNSKNLGKKKTHLGILYFDRVAWKVNGIRMRDMINKDDNKKLNYDFGHLLTEK